MLLLNFASIITFLLKQNSSGGTQIFVPNF